MWESIHRLQSRLLMTLAVCALGTVASQRTVAAADLLDRIKERGELVVATEARYPPFEMVEEGEIIGYSADLMKHIMQDLPEVKLNRLDLPWQGVLPGLAAKKFDYVVTAVTITKKRAARYHLSLPIADATQGLVKRRGDDSIQSPEDIVGKVVASQAGSAPLQALELLIERVKNKTGKEPKRVETYVDFNEAYADLAAGRVAAVVNALPNLAYLAKTRPEIFEVVGTFGPKKYMAWAGRPDEDSKRLVAFFDHQIAVLNLSGIMADLQEKWFGYAMDVPWEEFPEPAE